MDITPNYVSVIKGKMKRGRKAKRKAKQSQEEGAEKVASRGPGAGRGGLSPEDIVELAGLARKAGGYDKLREFLTALNRIK